MFSVAALTLWTLRSYAAPLPVTLSYDAPWECPNQDQFWRQLRGRSTRLAEQEQRELGIRIDAKISGSFSSYHGHLTLLGHDNSVVERDVSGPNCVDVSAALALITAVSIDGLRSNSLTDGSAPLRQEKAERRFSIGPVVGIHTGVAPHTVPTIGLAFVYHDWAKFGSPEFRLAAMFGWSQWQAFFDGGDARFRWFASRSTACPFQVRLASAAIGPCALLELGALTGEGRTGNGVKSETGLWLAPGALLNVAVRADPVWLRLAGGAVTPALRHQFQFLPNPVAFHVDSVALTAEFELAWAFK